MRNPSRPRPGLPAQAAALLRDERGTITIEFVIWLPLLMFWFVASVAFYQAYKSRNDASNVAHTLTDILSRQVEVNDAFFTELYALQDQLMPNAPAGATLRVTNVRYDAGNTRYEVLWSRAIGGPLPYPAGEIVSEIFPQMAGGDTVVLMELSIPYASFTDWDGVGDRTWNFAMVARPRFVSSISLVN